MTKLIGQDSTVKELSRIFEIFVNSDASIRPHFILTGPSGSGKTAIVQMLAKKFKLEFQELNAASLTKEGMSGNSLSKALTCMKNIAGKKCVVFADEFDKLFISGNSNSDLANESTNGVQNEFLKILEADKIQVMGDYGHYPNVDISNTLFIFAGAFNGESDIDLDKLRQFGVKTEFLGRVGLVYNLTKINLEDMYLILEQSPVLDNYLKLFTTVDRTEVIEVIKEHIRRNYDNNTLGVRMINTLINQYFIKGGMLENNAKIVTFQTEMKL